MVKIELESKLSIEFMEENGIKPVAVVYETSNYDLFKKMKGNRDLHKIAALKKSIKENGFLMQPICVNSNMEIGDGQNREAVCEDLSKPVYFVIDENVDLKKAIALNSGQRNWKPIDFIKAYAETGSLDYERLNALVNLFPQYEWKILIVASGKTITGGGLDSQIKNGKFTFSTDEYENAVKVVKELEAYTDDIKRFGYYGRKNNLYMALVFAIRSKNIDNKKMRERFNKYGDSVESRSVGDMRDAIKKLDGIYNRNTRAGRVNLQVEYENAVLESKERAMKIFRKEETS